MAKSRNDIQSQIIKKAWKDKDFKNAVLTNPKAAIEKEFGVKLPDGVNIKVLEETKDTFYLVLPLSPSESADANTALNVDADGEVGIW